MATIDSPQICFALCWLFAVGSVVGCQTLTHQQAPGLGTITHPEHRGHPGGGSDGAVTDWPRALNVGRSSRVSDAFGSTLARCQRAPRSANDLTSVTGIARVAAPVSVHGDVELQIRSVESVFADRPGPPFGPARATQPIRICSDDEPQIGFVEPVFADPSWGRPSELEEARDEPEDLQFAPWATFRSDASNLFPSLLDDGRATANWQNVLALSVAAGVAVAVHQDLDGQIRRNTARHPERWGEASSVLGQLGDYPVQVPVLFGTYGYSLWSGDEELHDVAITSMNAYALTTASTLVIKAAANTRRPSEDWNGGQFGFPSYHTASSFTFAAVLDEYYGPKVGLPAYTLAGLIGWSRIDERDHDLSDVLFGAALGYVVGKSVARHHRDADPCVSIMPYVDPVQRAAGVVFQKSF